ncbi:MAG: filamentous hemagglutinin N-terminal domain-containing protein [Hydrococcus sp. Prado102]|jgi:filamentous hemagglutinin family protein|nr:filamentous hemagglutinin N-terminal domain-containing protein [Hydrococcus sp. Prado102]
MSNRDRHLFSIPIQHLLLLTLSSFFVDWESQVFAQVVEDDTLGAERSIVTPNVVIKGVPSDRIDGGARRGANLFHSFGQFIIPEGRGAYFSNPDGIRTIFSRVTGGNGSQIFGTLGVLGNANLFLIDPKGIIFGANAKLDISGSFIGSTANGIAFPNGENFSATNPNAAPLLTIDVPVPVGLVFESDNSGIIFNAADLKNQQNLALIAGGILSSGQISAPGRNITLATVPGAVDSLVGLDGTGKFLGTIQGIGQPNLEGRDIVLLGGAIDASSNGIAGNIVLNSAGNTSLSNGATVNVLGAGGGSITVNAQNLSMSKGSQLSAGIRSGLGSPQAQAGNVRLNVADEIALSQSSGIENRVNENAIGNAGDINVRAGSLTLSEEAFLSATTFSIGNGGDININVDGSGSVRLNGSNSRISTTVDSSAIGNGGNIQIKAKSLSLTNGALLNTRIFGATELAPGGRGNAGDVRIQASDSITISGADNTGFSSGIYGEVFAGANGKASQIDLQANSIFLSNGARLSTNNFGGGKAGSIDIMTDFLALTNGSSFDVRGGGEGSITIGARIFELSEGSVFLVGIGQGLGSPGVRAGNVEINATERVKIQGDINFPSSISNTVELGSTADAGEVIINTKVFEGIGNFVIGSGIFGRGDAGKVTINATDRVSLEGLEGRASGILSAVAQSGVGNGSDIIINTRSLSLSNSAQLATSTVGQGNAGNIQIKASESVSIDSGSGLQAFTFGSGDAGDIAIEATRGSVSFDGATASTAVGRAVLNGVTFVGTGRGGDILIEARNFSVTNGASLFTATFGELGERGLPDAGDIRVNVSDTVFLSGGADLSSNTRGVGNAGKIAIQARSVAITNTAKLSASTAARGNGGDIIFDVDDTVTLSNGASVESSVASGATGKGGNINFQARSLSLSNSARLNASTQGAGDAGNIQINASDSVSFSRGASLATATGGLRSGNAGDIFIKARSLFVTDGANINASTASLFGLGEGGDIVLRIDETATFNNSSATSFVSTGMGKGGSIDIQARNLSLSNGAIVSTTTLGEGKGGNININASDSVQMSGNFANDRFSSLVTGTFGSGKVGDAGDLTITTGQLLVQNRAIVSTTTNSEGKGGKLTIDASDTVFLNRGFVSSGVLKDGQNNGGNIDIRARSLSVTNGSFLFANTQGQGDAGNITIDVDNDVTVSGVITQRLAGKDFVLPSAIASSVDAGGEGQGGDISIKAESLSLNNAGFLVNSTFDRGDAGSIAIKVDDFAIFNNFSGIQSNVEPDGVGIGGNVNIQARSLTLNNGSSIQAGLRAANDESPGGIGQGGNISINTSDFVEISGTNPRQISIVNPLNSDNSEEPLGIEPPSLSSGLFTSTQTGASGSAGNIFISTEEFRLADGAVVEAQTANFGRAGNITIDANTIDLTGGAQIISATRGSGDAGDLRLRVKDSLTLSGSDPNFERRLAGVGGDRDRITNIGPESGLFANTDIGSTGDGGNIFIENYPNTATINDGAVVTVNSQGRGEGGQIQLTAGSLTLDNGTLSAQSNQTGELVGNINLDVQNLLLLRNGSQISTTVGVPGAGGDGGRITINTGAIVAVPNENSDITANAFEGTGGNISISTDSIFGIDFRERLTPLSDITASSNAGFTGNVIINTSGIDPTRGLENLPQDNINVQVAQGCQVGTNGESNISFYDLGRGGVPPSPDDLLNSPFTGEWLMLESQESNNVEINSFEQKQERDRFSLRISCGK